MLINREDMNSMFDRNAVVIFEFFEIHTQTKTSINKKKLNYKLKI